MDARAVGDTPAIGFDTWMHGNVTLGYNDGDNTYKVSVSSTYSGSSISYSHIHASKIILQKDLMDSVTGRIFTATGEKGYVGTGRYDTDFNNAVLVPSGVHPAFRTQSLVLSGKIGVNFFLDLSVLSDDEKAASYMTFEISGRGTITDRDNFDDSFKNNTNNYYGFTCYVNAIQMADTITATFHYTQSGTDRTVTKTYSVKDYFTAFDAELSTNPSAYSDKTKALVYALADYGHYLQPYLSKVRGWTMGTGSKQYAEMDKHYTESVNYNFETVKNEVSNYTLNRTDDADIEAVTYSLTFDSDTCINVYFNLKSDYSENGRFDVTVDNVQCTPEKLSDSLYRVKITDIHVQDLENQHTITVTTDSGTMTVNVSGIYYVFSLINNHQASDETEYRNAAAAIYYYWKAADDFNPAN